jgi:hypothetical protein
VIARIPDGFFRFLVQSDRFSKRLPAVGEHESVVSGGLDLLAVRQHHPKNWLWPVSENIPNMRMLDS